MIPVRPLFAAIFAALALLALAAIPAAARSGGIKYASDYSDVRGFNYNTVSSRGYVDQWNRYDHAEIDRHMGYAERLHLNMARVFLAYGSWKADPARFRTNIRDFVRTAYAKGLSRRTIIWKHALRNALNPVITAITGWFAELLAGAFFIEYIFGWKGIGKVTVDALEKLDFPVVMGSVLVTALFFILINILADILYGIIDPRVRLK